VIDSKTPAIDPNDRFTDEVALRWKLKEKPGEYEATPADPDVDPGVDETLVNPLIGASIQGFQKGVEGLAKEHGATFEEISHGLRKLIEVAEEEPVMLHMFLESMVKPVFFPDVPGESMMTPNDTEGPVYFPGAPEISNPGALPMRPDEPGTPLIVSGQVRLTDGTPLAGAELDIWLAAITGHYSNTELDDQPLFNLRGRMFTDEEGRYEFRAVKPVPYYIPVIPDGLMKILRGLGFSKFRARHLHVKIRHPKMAEEFTTQLYFKSDPYFKYDAITATRPDAAALALETELHDDPAEIAARGLDEPFETAHFDFFMEPANQAAAAA
jgi:catechol 1,2-dioxygenase